MTARFVLLGTTAIAAIAAGAFLYLRGTDESWYGFSLGEPVEEVPNVRIARATAMYPESDTVDAPPPPWSQILLSVSRDTRRITGIEFTDLGAPFVECVAAPCPPEPRLKPVALTRTEGALVRVDMVRRMGEPTGSYGAGNETTSIWDFDDPGFECVRGRPRPRVLAGDRSGLVRRVTLRLSDDMVWLEVVGRARDEPIPGIPAPPSPPAPPRPPPPRCS